LDGRPSRHVALDFKPAIRHLTAIDRGLAGIFERGTRTARNGCEDGLAPPMRDASLPKRAQPRGRESRSSRDQFEIAAAALLRQREDFPLRPAVRAR
jgi:hypothetical protein